MIIIAMLAATTVLTTSCWTDTINYNEFVCERFGGDADNDGHCTRLDCNDNNPFIYIGAPCDDDDPETENDVWTAECECAGS